MGKSLSALFWQKTIKFTLSYRGVNVKYIVQSAILLGLFILVSCSRETLSGNTILPHNSAEPSMGSEEAYLKARSKWTIILNSVGREAGPSFILPLSQGGMHGFDFPLTVTATMMHDQVIESGFSYYENAIRMTPEQAASFRQAYRSQNEVDRYLLIEASLQTRMAENYLDLDRWSIFIEDDAGNRNVPEKIVEQPGSSQVMEGMMEDPIQKRPMPFDWTHHRKTVLFYFSRKDYYGKSLLHENLKELKLVFLLEKGGSGRGEGIWIFNDKKVIP
jgi:hypothetical protein